jgi:hypothetical protein
MPIPHKSHFFLWGRRRSLPRNLMKRNALQEVYWCELNVSLAVKTAAK